MREDSFISLWRVFTGRSPSVVKSGVNSRNRARKKWMRRRIPGLWIWIRSQDSVLLKIWYFNDTNLASSTHNSVKLFLPISLMNFFRNSNRLRMNQLIMIYCRMCESPSPVIGGRAFMVLLPFTLTPHPQVNHHDSSNLDPWIWKGKGWIEISLSL